MVLYQRYSPKDWWTYISIVDIDCLQTEEIHNCSKAAIEKLGINYEQFSEKVNGTFSEDGSDNSLFKIEEEEYTKKGHFNFPGIVINNMIYRVYLF